MTQSETIAFNAGVRAVLTIAEKSALAIARVRKRPLHEAFAVEALAEFAEACKALLLPIERTPG